MLLSHTCLYCRTCKLKHEIVLVYMPRTIILLTLVHQASCFSTIHTIPYLGGVKVSMLRHIYIPTQTFEEDLTGHLQSPG